MTIRQYSMLRMFNGQGYTTDEALRLHQTTFGSLCRRKWLRFNAKSAQFEVTPAGSEMYRICSTLDMYRKHASDKFSVYVSLPKARLHMVPRKGPKQAHATLTAAVA